MRVQTSGIPRGPTCDMRSPVRVHAKNKCTIRQKRGPMNLRTKAVAAGILAACLAGTHAFAGDPPAAAKKPVHKRAEKPKGPTLEEQLQQLRQDMQSQIDSLKSDLAAKDAALKQAQQQAADAQA